MSARTVRRLQTFSIACGWKKAKDDAAGFLSIGVPRRFGCLWMNLELQFRRDRTSLHDKWLDALVRQVLHYQRRLRLVQSPSTKNVASEQSGASAGFSPKKIRRVCETAPGRGS
eukprot:GHVS01014691.1.p2 GENE.GHVS01014691.1~~GHVS01014691.1.p2  ORF type:complete len:114 (-),score=7.25 GHVS01014691.1:528-869(-)